VVAKPKEQLPCLMICVLLAAVAHDHVTAGPPNLQRHQLCLSQGAAEANLKFLAKF
jgi:hypothetical protein